MTVPKQGTPHLGARSDAESEFLANIGHEVLTPLNAVLGMTGLLLETSLTPEQKNYVETIRDSGEALLSLLRRVIDFSRLEEGKMELEEKSFGLADLLDDVVGELGPSAMEKGLELAYLADPSVPAEARCDAGKLRQILSNILGNAIKFTNHGEVLLNRHSPAGGAKLGAPLCRA